MYKQLIASARPHYSSVAHLMQRDLPLQVASLAALCLVCWIIGHSWIALGVGSSIAVSELVLFMMFNRRGIFQDFDKDKTLAVALPICCFNAVLYFVPAFCLASEPSVAMKATGMIWVIGGLIYVINSWARVPPFLVAMLIQIIVMLVLCFYALSLSDPIASSRVEWTVAAGFLLIFLYTTLDTLRLNLVSAMELRNAQEESAARLSQLEESQRIDKLTGLLNRTAFDRALHVILEDRAASGGETAVFLVDLDSFKPINDTYSHAAGDTVLVETADRLLDLVGEMGIVGRLGGDEFICAVYDMSNPDEIIAFGQAICETISRPVQWHERRLKISASVGAAVTGADLPATVPALCSGADQAMFAAKSSPNRLPVLYESHLFAPHMTAQDKQLLIDGILDRTLCPFYQPKIHLPTGQIIGFEALARWNHTSKGVQAPAEFIEQINELGLQGDFMASMARQVVEDISRMVDQQLDPGQVSLNVSEIALATHSGRKELYDIVAAHPKAAKHLTLEITEDVFIARAADTIQASIANFRELGVRISLDDFGTGFASFHHLRQLDFDELKIDTSFVAGLGQDPTSEVLVRGFLDIAAGLGVNVIAEGVETEDQRRDLMNMGCQTAQGFLFSAALPFDNAVAQLSDQHAA